MHLRTFATVPGISNDKNWKSDASLKCTFRLVWECKKHGIPIKPNIDITMCTVDIIKSVGFGRLLATKFLCSIVGCAVIEVLFWIRIQTGAVFFVATFQQDAAAL